MSTQREAFLETRTRVVELVRRFGGFTTDAVLDPHMQTFTHGGIHGFIGYRLSGGCMVIFGDPICAVEDLAPLAKAFHHFAEKEGKEVIYIGASEKFAHWALRHLCGALIEFGKELIFDPTADPRKNVGTQGSLVRRKVKQALRENVQVFEHTARDPSLESSMERIKELWLQRRKGPQVHISNVYLFDDCVGKRWFYARRGEDLVGLVLLNQLESHNGWLINHLMVIPDAPNGTSELLIVSALEALAQEGCCFATVGAVTAERLGEISGLGFFCSSLARIAFGAIRKVVHLDGLSTFWGKFQPKSRPSYLLFSRSCIGLKELISLKNVLRG